MMNINILILEGNLTIVFLFLVMGREEFMGGGGIGPHSSHLSLGLYVNRLEEVRRDNMQHRELIMVITV
jgi:hypothetical protein